MSLEITEDLIDQQPTVSRALIRVLLAKFEELEARLKQDFAKFVEARRVKKLHRPLNAGDSCTSEI